jgi:amino acid adenylation domain-containing protein
VNRAAGDVDIVSGEERRQLLEEFNKPSNNNQTTDATLVSLFEAQVEKNPDAPAILGGCDAENGIETITYGELNRRANRLAHHLISRGAGAGKIVCVVMKPSLDMAVGLWAILKTGACYLPVDPGYPSDSLDYLMRESSADFTLTHQNMEFSGSDENPPAKCRPSDAAYIIFTSGTTGRPKGVVVEHRNIANTLAARREIYRLDELSVSLQLLSFMFDAFVISFFTPLTGGGAVVLLKEEEIRNIELVCRTIAGRNVTHLVCVPTLYSVLIQHLSPQDAASVRMVTLGGDSLSAKLLAATQEKNEQIEVVNEYGITEAAVTTTLQRHQQRLEEIRVGSPIADTKVYVVDNRLRLQPLGVPGELCVGGKGISRGYLNKPELTAERFVPNPFEPGEVMYRSGDWARWGADGALRLLGRMDEQVKIRGYRIELQEIENALLAHPTVREAVVTAHETPQGDRLLAAFIVPVEAGGATPPELERFLQNRLPDYMVPRHFQQLGQLPLTANGKVDRAQLTKVALTLQPHNEYVAPRTPMEERLADIWAKVLEVEKVGIHDHFFNSGGDSIRSISLLSLINQEFETQFKIVELYEADTIEAFAKKLDGNRETAADGAGQKVRDNVADLKDRFLNQF